MADKRLEIKDYEPEYQKDEHGEFYNIKVPYKNGHIEAQVDIADFAEMSKLNWSVCTIRGIPKYLTRYTNRDEQGHRHRMQLHQFIMDTKASTPIDHIDGNGMNCRRYNMRLATRTENARNRIKKTKNTTSIYKGISWNTKQARWVVSIRYNKKGIHLGSYPKVMINGVDEGEKIAARVYDKAAIKYFGSFARVNMPEERNLVTTLTGENFRQSRLMNEQETKEVEQKIRELQRFKAKEMMEIMQVMSLKSHENMCHYYGCGIEELIREIQNGIKVKVKLG